MATYRTRLRFRLLKKLNITEAEYRFEIAGHEVVLSAPTPGQAIQDSEWLVMNTRGFGGEAEAVDFGHRLRAAIELSSVATRLGVDAGRDLPTSALASFVKDAIEKKTGALIRDNIHGVDVFVDDPNVTIFGISGTDTVLANHEPFLPLLGELYTVATSTSEQAKDVILLLDYALLRPEPVAQIVFAFSAVETLGQDETWTVEQKSLLKELTKQVASSSIGSDAERSEVMDALRKGLHRLSLRQGVLRLLDRLGLAHLKPQWDELYSERSTLVHGLAPRPGADYSALAHKTVSLCGRILLTATAFEVPAVGRYIDLFYGLPKHLGEPQTV